MGLASRGNEIMSKAGFNNLLDRSPAIETPSNFGMLDIESSFPDRSIPLNKLQHFIYKAVVSQDGTGTHLDIQNAIDDVNSNGGGAIFITNGTYILNNSLLVYPNIALIGENKYKTIIDCNAGNNQITTTDITIYATGTITATYNNATIVGSGTDFANNLSVGDFIIIDNNTFEIASITDETNLELTEKYYGHTQAGVTYQAGTFSANIQIQNFSIRNFTGGASTDAPLYLLDSVNSFIDNIIVEDVNLGDGVKIHFCTNIIAQNTDCRNIYDDGFNVLSSQGCQFVNINSYNCGTVGAPTSAGISVSTSDSCKFTNCKGNNNQIGVQLFDCDNTKFVNLECLSNWQYGVLCNQSDNNDFSNVTIKKNGLDGFILYGGVGNSLTGGTIKDNGQTTDDTYSEIFLRNNSNEGIPSTYNKIIGINIKSTATNKAKYGIRENDTDQDYNIISSNSVQGAVTSNISIQGANTVLSANIN